MGEAAGSQAVSNKHKQLSLKQEVGAWLLEIM